MANVSASIITKLLKINAIKLNIASPFTWASGWKSPIYCDNRSILSYPQIRKEVCESFCFVINSQFQSIDVIAGVATGAIAHGVLVADALEKPFVYVRPEPKKHGLSNQIEGHVEPGQRVLVIEDLISTGNSSLNAVRALRQAGAQVLGMVAIFTYGFPQAQDNFDREGVTLYTLASYSQLIDRAFETGSVSPEQLESLMRWRMNPETWGQ